MLFFPVLFFLIHLSCSSSSPSLFLHFSSHYSYYIKFSLFFQVHPYTFFQKGTACYPYTQSQSITLFYTSPFSTGLCGAITSTRYLAEQNRWLQSYRLHPLSSSTIRSTSGFPHFLHAKVMVLVNSSLLYSPSLIKNIPASSSIQIEKPSHLVPALCQQWHAPHCPNQALGEGNPIGQMQCTTAFLHLPFYPVHHRLMGKKSQQYSREKQNDAGIPCR